MGSHMWKMNHKESDFDVFVAFAVDTKDLLRGTAKVKSKHKQYDEESGRDEAIHEIGHIVSYRIQGNVNFLWGIHSPMVISEHAFRLKNLKDISLENPSRAPFHSINGLARKNIRKYVENPPKAYDEEKIQKKMKIIMRTLNFGFDLIMDGEFNFNPITMEVTLRDLEDGLEALSYAYENSPYPKVVDEKPFRDYLEDTRRVLDE